MKIGFFDSGIGGLSVLHHALKKLPHEQFLYYADSRHVPYGEKTEAEIAAYADAAIDFLLDEGVKAIVLACNTATSAAGETIRKRYPVPIIGMEPAVKKALETYGKGRILVAATSVTVKGEKLQLLIGRVDTRHVVDLLALPKLVCFAKAGVLCRGCVFRARRGLQLSRRSAAELRLERIFCFGIGRHAF